VQIRLFQECAKISCPHSVLDPDSEFLWRSTAYHTDMSSRRLTRPRLLIVLSNWRWSLKAPSNSIRRSLDDTRSHPGPKSLPFDSFFRLPSSFDRCHMRWR